MIEQPQIVYDKLRKMDDSMLIFAHIGAHRAEGSQGQDLRDRMPDSGKRQRVHLVLHEELRRRGMHSFIENEVSV